MKELATGAFSRSKKNKTLSNSINLISIQNLIILLLIIPYLILTCIVKFKAFRLIMLAHASKGLADSIGESATLNLFSLKTNKTY